MRKQYVHLSFLVMFALMVACDSAISQNETSLNTNHRITAPTSSSNHLGESSKDEVESLCNRLIELRTIPYDVEELADDEVYDGLVKMGTRAIPCLIKKITDITKMEDPRTAPHVEDFRVGDAAFFMLLYITKEKWQPETMFSAEYAKLWRTEGVYAYFAYVEKPANRKRIQLWWKDWAKKHLRQEAG